MVEESGTLESQLEATKVRTIPIKDCENKTVIYLMLHKKMQYRKRHLRD